MNNEVVELYLDDIIPNRFQPREVFNDQALKELAISIREHGVIQPIIVRKFGEKYEIIAGERRYKASTMAGLTKIPAIVRNLDDKESSKVALIENLQRRDLTPIEEARTYQKILDLDEMTQEDLAKTMGKSQSAVSNKLRLLSLPDEVQEALLKEEISERHARSLLNVSDKNVQVNLLKEIISNKMTVRELDSKIKALNNDNYESSNSFEEVKVITPTENNVDTNIDNNINDNKESNINNEINANNSNANNLNNGSMETAENKNVQPEESLFGTNVSVPDNNDLFGVSFDNPVNNNENNNSLNNENASTTSSENGINNDLNSLNNIPDNENKENKNPINDPTIVDIDKIREHSTDISTIVENVENKEKNNIDDLLKIGSANVSESNNNESSNNGNNSTIAGDLLSKMPVIKPTSDENNTNNANNISTINNGNTENNTLKNNETSNLNISNNSVVSNNVEIAVESVKAAIKFNQSKGYKISIEELNLDNEIQLIVKFSKN